MFIYSTRCTESNIVEEVPCSYLLEYRYLDHNNVTNISAGTFISLSNLNFLYV